MFCAQAGSASALALMASITSGSESMQRMKDRPSLMYRHADTVTTSEKSTLRIKDDDSYHIIQAVFLSISDTVYS